MGSQDRTLSFQLTNILSRQIFEYKVGAGKILIMYDSGAQIPVWCRGEKLLKAVFPDAVKTEYCSNIFGFGKNSEPCEIYCIPRFILSDGKNEFAIKNLYLAEIYKPSIGCHLLLSETMFSKTDTTTIRRGQRVLMVTYDEKGRDYVCTARRKGKELKTIAVWSQ